MSFLYLTVGLTVTQDTEASKLQQFELHLQQVFLLCYLNIGIVLSLILLQAAVVSVLLSVQLINHTLSSDALGMSCSYCDLNTPVAISGMYRSHHTAPISFHFTYDSDISLQ